MKRRIDKIMTGIINVDGSPSFYGVILITIYILDTADRHTASFSFIGDDLNFSHFEKKFKIVNFKINSTAVSNIYSELAWIDTAHYGHQD